MRILFLCLFLFLFHAEMLAGDRVKTTQLIENEIERVEATLPIIEQLFEYHLRDVTICVGPDKYYLTGTTDDYQGVNEGIRVWESTNLHNWRPLGGDGFVWTFEDDGTDWQKEISLVDSVEQRAILYPEMHYINSNYWITYTVSNSMQSGLLRSETGLPAGPYKDISGDEPFIDGVDVTMFKDTNGEVYLIWNGGKIRKLNSTLTGFDEPNYRLLTDKQGKVLDCPGIYVFRENGVYFLAFAQWNAEGPEYGHLYRNEMHNTRAADGRYDCMVATSSSLLGSYNKPYLALPHCGHGAIFKDFTGKYHSTLFGNDAAAPFRAVPAIVEIEITDNNQIKPLLPFPTSATQEHDVVYISKLGNNSNGTNWNNAFTSIQRAVDNSPNGTQFWIAKGKYSDPVKINIRRGLYFYGGFLGVEDSLHQRNIEQNTVIFNGRNYEKHVVALSGSSYIRFDGITITGGNASGSSFNEKFGGGVYAIGGGESNRFVNCTIQDNKADQDGAGVYASIGATPMFISCTFSGNIAQRNGGAAAIYCNSANGYHAKFYNCIIDNNKAYQDGGAIYFDTNLKQTGLLRISNCIISNNYTQLERGAITMDRGSNLLLVNSTVCYNHGVSNGTSVASLGRVPAQNRIINCIFMGNTGGTLFNIEGASTGNSFTDVRPWVQFRNCIFYNNKTRALVKRNFDGKTWQTVDEMNESIIARSCYNEDPMFVKPEEGNFHLRGQSPAINKGTLQSCFYIDMDGDIRYETPGTTDIGADEFKR